jgi:hypothetical protein
LLLFAGIELAIAARDMCTKAVGLIAARTVAKAPGTGGAERSNGVAMRWSSGRARREVDTRRSKAAGRGRRPPLLESATNWSCVAAGCQDVKMGEMEIG